MFGVNEFYIIMKLLFCAIPSADVLIKTLLEEIGFGVSEEF